MGRRIRWLGLVMILCFVLVMLQLVNIQFRRAPSLAADPANPRNQVTHFNNDRGAILAADGTILAQSVPNTSGSYKYHRVYPDKNLYSGIVGYSSIFYGTSGIEYQYNSDLVSHTQPAQSFAQALGLDAKPVSTDDVTLTVVPALQKVAEQALASVPGFPKDGAAVAMNPKTGAIEALYSSPSFDPNPLSSPSIPTEQLAYLSDTMRDSEGFRPLRPMATEEFFQPGSTSKVLTTAAVYDDKPALTGFKAPYQTCTTLPNSNKPLCGEYCGGTMADMLPPSCDQGYGLLGLQLGGSVLNEQAMAFGYNQVPPIDLPFTIAASYPSALQLAQLGCNPTATFHCYGLPGVAYASIGQQSVDTTALQNALVASAIADNGVIMTPHLMSQIRDSAGNIVTTYKPKPWKTATTPQTAAAIIPLMRAVATSGTAAGVGFPRTLDAAVKTGTAQTGNPLANTDDWMIGFAPATNPVIAVAVVVPNEPQETDGAEIAGPIVKALLIAAVAMSQSAQSSPSGTTSTTHAKVTP